MKENQPRWRAPHQPVLYQQVIDILQPHTSCRYVDGTVGAGGHAAGILEASKPHGQLLALDLDEMALKIAQDHLNIYNPRVFFRHGSYAVLTAHISSIGWDCVNGIILDLGVSSMQLDTAERGFSFSKAAPLDMRFDINQNKSAADLVNHLSEGELEKIIRLYGEDPSARRIAAAITTHRPIFTTTELATVIEKSTKHHRGPIHPATRTFQALRIAVNRELDELDKGLKEAIKCLCSGGRLVVISFHSLEDRQVKQYFQQENRGCLCPPKQPICTCKHQASVKMLTKKIIKPTLEETESNPRARSAKMRAVEKI